MVYSEVLSLLPEVASAPQTYDLFRCNTCGLVYTDCYSAKLIDIVEMSECYEKRIIAPYLALMQPFVDASLASRIAAGEELQSVQETHWNRLLGILKKFVPPGTRLAEVGSCYGGFAEFMRLALQPSRLLACEMNQGFLAELQRRYPNLETTSRLIEDWPNDEQFDLLFCSDVIEHIWDFESFLKVAASRLCEGGRLVVVTPNVECAAAREAGLQWWGYLVPHHCQLFTATALREAGRRAGLVMVEDGASFEELIVVLEKGAAAF